MSATQHLIRLAARPVALAVAKPQLTGALLLAILYYPEKLQQRLPARLFEYLTSARFVKALKFVVGFGLIKAINDRLSHNSANNWKRNSKFIKSQEVVLVTGGCSGIGLLIAKKFSRLGCKVAVLDLNPPKETLGAGIRFYQCDVTSSEKIREAAVAIRHDLGDPTVLINNAGIGSAQTILAEDEATIRKTFEVNTIAHFLTVKEFVPSMIKRDHGHIVTIASAASFVTIAGNVDYSCTKAGALAFHEGLATELKHRYNAPNVKTTVVHPSWVRTPLIADLVASPKFRDPVIEAEDVSSPLVDHIVAGKSGQLFFPSWLRVISNIRAWPTWMQNTVRSSGARTLDVEYHTG